MKCTHSIPLALVIVAALSLTGCPSVSPNVEYVQDQVYGQGYVAANMDATEYVLRDLLYDRMTPTDAPETGKPAVVLVHGGGFDGGNRKDEELVAFADSLATRGYVCFLIEYRLSPEMPPAPAPYDDVAIERAAHAAAVDAKAAMRFVRANAEEFGIDPDHIAIFGESAGAIAALAVGVSDADTFARDGEDFPIPESNYPEVDPTPQAVIDFWGTADFFLNLFDSSDPPIMVVHGALDFEVGISLAPAINIIDRCEAVGILCRPFLFLNEGHGAWDAQWDDKPLSYHALEFLQDTLEGPGPGVVGE
ncbi:MAG: alpha/beta hydrolase [Candidatus Hydrogenedentes bacterium]|nr:alpha/beta hydrolase [Candidatus Hydrogenedentota bacterium]